MQVTIIFLNNETKTTKKNQVFLIRRRITWRQHIKPNIKHPEKCIVP